MQPFEETVGAANDQMIGQLTCCRVMDCRIKKWFNGPVHFLLELFTKPAT